MKWWWLSFSDDLGIVGCAIAQGVTHLDANAACSYLENTPTDRGAGGETAIWPVPADLGPPPTGYVGRLLTTEEADAMWAAWCPQEPRCGLLSEMQAEIDAERAS